MNTLSYPKKSFHSNLPYCSSMLTTVSYKVDGPVQVGDCISLEQHGLWLETFTPVPENKKVELKFSLPSVDALIYVWGIVQQVVAPEHKAGKYSMLIVFYNLGERERGDIQQYLRRTSPELLAIKPTLVKKLDTDVEVPTIGFRRESHPMTSTQNSAKEGMQAEVEHLRKPIYLSGAKTEELPTIKRSQQIDQPLSPSRANVRSIESHPRKPIYLGGSKTKDIPTIKRPQQSIPYSSPTLPSLPSFVSPDQLHQDHRSSIPPTTPHRTASQTHKECIPAPINEPYSINRAVNTHSLPAFAPVQNYNYKVDTNVQAAFMGSRMSVRLQWGDDGLYRVYVRYLDAQSFLDAYNANIRHGGELLQINRSLPVDSIFRVQLLPPQGSRGVWLEARMVWQDPKQGIAIQFEHLTVEQLSLIELYIAEAVKQESVDSPHFQR